MNSTCNPQLVREGPCPSCSHPEPLEPLLLFLIQFFFRKVRGKPEVQQSKKEKK
jgi:hypothetical protein